MGPPDNGDDDDVLDLLDDDHEPMRSTVSTERWSVLIVDDEPDVHQTTALVLRDLPVEGRLIRFVSAYSAKEAFDILSADGSFAIILLDVVMESPDSGLRLVRQIREELRNQTIRIILRTGQPGYAPEIASIRDYDINDYKTKSELTRVRLFTSLTVALRAYRQMRSLEAARRSLEMKEQELVRSQSKLRALAAHLEKVREEERGYIARELHDEMGQYLTALRMEASMLPALFADAGEAVSQRLGTMRELIDHVIADTRRVISRLRPVVLDLGLVSAAEWLAADFQARTGIRCHLEAPAAEMLELDRELATTLFRILQESLTNVCRHARAQSVEILIFIEGDCLRLVVRDDGVGFDSLEVREKKTFGLMGIRERVLIYGGTARVESRIGAAHHAAPVEWRHIMIRILVADDHAVVRQGIRQVLSLGADLHVVGEARDGWEVLEILKTAEFDLVLLDMSMPGPSGVALLKRLAESHPHLPVLVLSMHDESQIVARALKAGARGYVTKDSEPESLINAVRRVAGGGQVISPDLAQKLVFETGMVNEAPPVERLSNREYEIFLQLVRGTRLSDIADALHLSPKTVSTHKMRIMQKLDLKSSADLVRYAVKHGLCS